MLIREQALEPPAQPAGDEPEQLLVVDDAAAIRETLCAVLTAYGYRVTAVPDATSALQCAASQPFHLALLDINLPDRSGVDLIEPLHRLQPHLAVIMLTGEATTMTAIKAMNNGATGYLTKPWNEEKTVAAIREALYKQRLASENARLVRELQKELEERRRAEQAAQTQRAVAEALAETAAVVNSSLDINEIIDQILLHVGRVVPHEMAAFLLINDGVARVIRSHSLAPQHPGDSFLGLRFPLAESPTLRRMVETLQPVVVADTGRATPLASQPAMSWVRAYAGAPIAAGSQVIGFLTLSSATPNFFTPEHGRHLGAFAHQAGIAIRNATLYARTSHLLKTTKAQAQQMHRIFDTVSDGLVLLDQRRRVLMSNPLGRDYLRHLCGDSQGPGPIERLGSEPLADLLAAVPATGATHDFIAGEPEPRIFQTRIYTLPGESDDAGWLLVLHDATEEQAQKSYLQRQDQLATVGRMAAGIAHDFNNIMAVITLYAQVLGSAELSDKNRERLRVILEQAKSASALIRQILDFSRQSVLERRPLHLTTFLKELMKLAQRTLPETIQLDFAYGDDDHAIYADPTRIQQALLNLLVNAADAMPGGGSLSVTLERLDRGFIPTLPDMPRQEWIHIAVSDTGTGIPAGVLPHIFEPFFTTKPPGEGTGLGLAQVYGIVTQHDGFIDVSNRPGAGITFHLYFPPLQIPKTGILEVAARTGPLAAGELVMVVEDNEYIRSALCETLEALNYRVLAAADGVEALQLAATHGGEIAAVLSDMVMPHMGGRQLYDELARRLPGVGIVLFSGYPLDDESKALIEGGRVTWLEKPFTRGAVANAIRAVSFKQ
jgi:two-component system, cell cycle sensor histidine kinase and response regulator CckA